jgi:hypothetical protein
MATRVLEFQFEVDMGTKPPPEIHIANLAVDPDTAYCGDKRNGRPLRPDATPTCVVCIDLSGMGMV